MGEERVGDASARVNTAAAQTGNSATDSFRRAPNLVTSHRRVRRAHERGSGIEVRINGAG